MDFVIRVVCQISLCIEQADGVIIEALVIAGITRALSPWHNDIGLEVSLCLLVQGALLIKTCAMAGNTTILFVYCRALLH